MKNHYVVFEKNKEGARILTNPSHADLLEYSKADAVILKNPDRRCYGVPPHLWKYNLKENFIYSDVGRNKPTPLKSPLVLANDSQGRSSVIDWGRAINLFALISLLEAIHFLIHSIFKG